MKNKEFIFNILLYSALFLFLLYPYRDYDWGWHYVYGNYFFQTGSILKEDLFSWTLPGYRWVNHSWAYDLLLYQLYDKFSFLGLSIAGALISLLTFHISLKNFKLDIYQKAILGALFTFLVSGVAWQGLRSQMIGYFLLSILMYLLFRHSVIPAKAGIHKDKSAWIPDQVRDDNGRLLGRWKYLASPLLFLVWANFHGTFILGLVIFSCFVFCQIIFQILKIKSEDGLKLYLPRHLLFLMASYLLSIATTFINPYTYYIYLESIRHFSSPLLKYILEWQPAQFNHPFTVTLFSYALTLVLGFALRRKLTDLPWMLTFSLTLYLALIARRYIADFAVVTLPFLALMVQDLNFRLDRLKVSTIIFLVAVIITLEIGLFRRVPDYHLLSYSFADYCYFGSQCSEGLTSYLQKNPPSGKGLNFYDWGGYLIGRGIKSQWFIDGRMHLWRRSGYEPFLDYQKMYYEGDIGKFNGYNFDYFIGHKDSLISQKLRTSQERGEWQEVYTDEYADYFIRK